MIYIYFCYDAWYTRPGPRLTQVATVRARVDLQVGVFQRDFVSPQRTQHDERHPHQEVHQERQEEALQRSVYPHSQGVGAEEEGQWSCTGKDQLRGEGWMPISSHREAVAEGGGPRQSWRTPQGERPQRDQSYPERSAERQWGKGLQHPHPRSKRGNPKIEI
jgi:hypothetical protein